MLAVKGLTVVVLLLVCWEDLRHRAVHWSLFPLTGLLFGAPAYLGRSHAAWLADLGMNALFLLVQAVALVAWTSLRYGRWTDPIGRMIGMGDVLFLAAIVPGLSFDHFAPYYVSGLVLCLVLHLTVLRHWPGQPRTVPTAGLLAAYLACWVVMEQLGRMPPLHQGEQAMVFWHG